MSDRRSSKSQDPEPNGKPGEVASPAMGVGPDPLELLEECLALFPESDPRQKILYKLRHTMILGQAAQQQRDVELKKVADVIAKLTAPANRVGTLLEVPGEGLARILVGGAEYYASVDPRVQAVELKIGAQILVNDAYAVIKVLGYDRNGPVFKVAEVLGDGRLRFEHEMGRQVMILQRSSDLAGVDLKAGDEVRIDPSLHVAIEKMEDRKAKSHLLDEVPTVTWEQIGGQTEAIAAIKKAIEYPLLHADTFQRFKFTQPKGFLLYGPPGCGKTLIGQAAAASLSKLVGESIQATAGAKGDKPPVTRGAFLHIKGPEILNMWLGESERMVRDLFAQARARRKEGALPFIFIDEAESVLGTRRASRSFNISSTLVPMFCSEMDGIESLHDVVIILASNRPDLIDPAVLRPGRIDRKIKVSRPNRESAAAILNVYLTDDLPLDRQWVDQHGGDRKKASADLVEHALSAVFSRNDENRLLSIRLRSGQNKVLYRSDLISGAILASIVQRAKEQAIERVIAAGGSEQGGMTLDDLVNSVHAEFREGEMLPPDDAAEEWLKLLDHHPEQVVGVSSFRRGRQAEEKLVGQII
ncbi:MAG: AAA family ATPase [Nitrospirota bacterium]|nr:AAA family ATPase [Nitrospirota bacterium]MDP2383337.1 AAA family ATPase [Nitrospirota bacterium]